MVPDNDPRHRAFPVLAVNDPETWFSRCRGSPVQAGRGGHGPRLVVTGNTNRGPNGPGVLSLLTAMPASPGIAPPLIRCRFAARASRAQAENSRWIPRAPMNRRTALRRAGRWTRRSTHSKRSGHSLSPRCAPALPSSRPTSSLIFLISLAVPPQNYGTNVQFQMPPMDTVF